MITVKQLLEHVEPNFANVHDRRKHGYTTKAKEGGFDVFHHEKHIGHGKDAAACTALMHKHHEERPWEPWGNVHEAVVTESEVTRIHHSLEAWKKHALKTPGAKIVHDKKHGLSHVKNAEGKSFGLFNHDEEHGHTVHGPGQGSFDEQVTPKTVRQLMEGRERKTEFKGGKTATGEKANTIDVAPRLTLGKKRKFTRGTGVAGAYDNRML